MAIKLVVGAWKKQFTVYKVVKILLIKYFTQTTKHKILIESHEQRRGRDSAANPAISHLFASASLLIRVISRHQRCLILRSLCSRVCTRVTSKGKPPETRYFQLFVPGKLADGLEGLQRIENALIKGFLMRPSAVASAD